MAYWQVFAERRGHTWNMNGEVVTSPGISLCAHCHPFDTLEQASDDILAWEHPGCSAYVVVAATSVDANHLVQQVFFEGERVPEVHLIGQIGPIQPE
jgi:hypothetical protein